MYLHYPIAMHPQQVHKLRRIVEQGRGQMQIMSILAVPEVRNCDRELSEADRSEEDQQAVPMPGSLRPTVDC